MIVDHTIKAVPKPGVECSKDGLKEMGQVANAEGKRPESVYCWYWSGEILPFPLEGKGSRTGRDGRQGKNLRSHN